MTEVFICKYKEFIKAYGSSQPNFRKLKDPEIATVEQILELEHII